MKRRIFYLCPDDDVPVGGNKMIYHHVDLLNRNGFAAYAVHSRPGFRYSWFQSDTAIAYPLWPFKVKVKLGLHDLKTRYRFAWDEPRYPRDLPLMHQGQLLPPINKSDVVVLSECMAPMLFESMDRQPFVIFNQNAYATFKELTLPNSLFSSVSHANPYQAPALLGVIVISKDNLDYLSYAFSGLPLYPVQLSVDAHKFAFSSTKLQHIAYMPRKCPNDIKQVIAILLQRGKLKGWTFVPIDKKQEHEVVEILKSAALFLSFSFQEGFSLPPLEALFCGCHVVGYQGQAAKEYLCPPYAMPIESNDIVSFAKAVETLALDFERNRAELLEQAQKNSAFLQSKYSLEKEEADLVNTWNAILSK